MLSSSLQNEERNARLHTQATTVWGAQREGVSLRITVRYSPADHTVEGNVETDDVVVESQLFDTELEFAVWMNDKRRQLRGDGWKHCRELDGA